jgi:hypothetical protein
MNAITLSWEDWRAVIDVMRAHGLPYEFEHADHVKQLLEQHAPRSTDGDALPHR